MARVFGGGRRRGRGDLPALNAPSGGQVVRAGVWVFVVVLGIVLVSTLVGSVRKTPRDKIGISYGGGPIEGQHFQRIVQPGSNLFVNGFADKLFLYPVTQRNYIISKRTDEGDVQGEDFVTAPSKDRIAIQFQAATYFKLNTDKLRKFHENIGLKYRAYTDDGFRRMLNASCTQRPTCSPRSSTTWAASSRRT